MISLPDMPVAPLRNDAPQHESAPRCISAP
jgi:hypothetical protein